jgi:creatinine amidohydrolase
MTTSQIPHSASSRFSKDTPYRVDVLFVNPIEYHGPHLPLTTDYEISLGLFREMKKRLSITHPSISWGEPKIIQKGCNPAPGPGSERTSLEDLNSDVIRVCDEFLAAEKKPDFVLFMTFHGAPRHAAAIERGIRYLRDKGIKSFNPFNLALLKLRDYEPSWVKPFIHLIEDKVYAEKWMRRLPEDFHGGTFETSLIQLFAPEKIGVDPKTVPDCPDRKPGLLWKAPLVPLRILKISTGVAAPLNEWKLAIDAVHWENDPGYLGYTGSPRYASAALGRELSEVLLGDYLRTFDEIVSGKKESPKPILQWTLHLN